MCYNRIYVRVIERGFLMKNLINKMDGIHYIIINNEIIKMDSALKNKLKDIIVNESLKKED